MSGPVRLVVVDDHPVVRDGLRGVFEAEPGFVVAGEAGDGEAALRLLAADTSVDVVLMDLRMPVLGGIETITRLRERGHPARILVLTTYDDDRDVRAALAAGATGYLLKDAPSDELVRAARAAHEGRAVLAPSVAGSLIGSLIGKDGGRSPEGPLSPRELEVLTLVADGATNAAVARRLLISETTVKTHLLHVFDKLGVRDRAAAVAAAYRRGLLG